MKRFSIKLRKKVVAKKAILLENNYDYDGLVKAKSFRVFDELFTAKAHGFTDRLDYYTKSSAVQFLKNVAIPTLMVNASDDPFLSPECFPIDIAESNPNFYLEIPKYGGHVGFATFNKENVLWSEQRAFDFIAS